MNLTELLAMPLIHTQQARSLGTVVGFAVRDKAVTHYLVVDDAYSDESAYAFDAVQVGKDALCTTAVGTLPPPKRIPFRCPVYTADGKQLGLLDEIGVTRGGAIESITVGEEKIGAAKIAAIDDIVVLAKPAAKQPSPGKSRRGRPRKNRPLPSTDESEQVAPETEAPDLPKSARPVLEESAQVAEAGKLRRVIGNYSFLLGRVLQEDLTQDGEVVLSAGRVLQDEDVALAWRKGLLVALTGLSRA